MQSKENIMTGSTMTNLNIRIDKTVKAEAEALLAELGLTMSTAINLFMRQTLRQRKIPFEIAAGGKSIPLPASSSRREKKTIRSGATATSGR
jgi:DNA-damage-inducible protein J